MIYGYSYYLDALCDHWDGLVLNDYEAVMPLPWRQKWSIYYLYQPFLVAQLGLFGAHPTPAMLEDFLKSIPKKFRYWDFMMNHQNVWPLPQFELYQRSNFVLNLHTPYEQLYKAYRENIRRNIKKAIGYQCTVQKDFGVDEVIALAQQQPANTATATDYNRFKNLYHFLHRQKQAITYGVYSATQQLLASCVFFFSHRRAYYILVGNHPNGRTLGASHLLIDAFIKDHAGQPLLLDFEGSDIRNLAFFYSSFGAAEEKFAAIKLNRLPWYVKWLKE